MIIRSPALLNPFQRATKASRCFNEWVGRLTLVWEPVVMVRCPHLTISITRVCQFCRAASTNLCVFVSLYHSIGSELYQDAKRASTANFQIDEFDTLILTILKHGHVSRASSSAPREVSPEGVILLAIFDRRLSRITIVLCHARVT